MKYFGLAVTISLGVSFAPLQAEEVVVRAGWHPNFTRLTVPLAGALQWSLGREGAVYHLRVPSLTYDVTKVFDRIGVDRVARTRMGDNGDLEIALACDCHIRAFEDGRALLVLDVHAGPAPLGSRFEGRLGEVSVTSQLQETTDEFDLNGYFLTQVLSAPPRVVPTPPPVLPLSPVRDAVPLPVAPQIALRDTQDLSLTLDPAALRSETGEVCRSDAALSFDFWPESTDIWSQISDGYAELYGSGDAVTYKSVTTLAKRLIVAGLGREAEVALSLYPMPSDEMEVLRAVAQLVGGEDGPSLLKSQRGCGGRWELWGALANVTAPLSSLQLSQAMTALMELSMPLRAQLAGDMGMRLYEAGSMPEALAMVSLGGDEPSARNLAVLLANTQLGPRAAAEELSSLFAKGVDVAPQTIMRLAEAISSQGLPLPPRLIDQVAAVRQLNRDTIFGPALVSAEVRLLLAGKELGLAEVVFADFGKNLARDEQIDLQGALVAARAETENDLGFLAYALELSPENLPPKVSNDIAKRLINLGFAEAAQSFLQGRATGDAMLTRRHLRAESALALGQNEAARAALLGLSDATALQLQARLEGARPAEAEEEQWWRQGAWGRLAASENPLFVEASRMALAPTQALETSTLAQAEALLRQATSIEQMSDQLLNNFTSPAALK